MEKQLIRSFIALEISEEIRGALISFLDKVKGPTRAAGIYPSWVNPQGMHLTLKFLGNIETDNIEPIGTALTKAAQGVRPFYIKVAGLGLFPHERRPRILWIGLKEGQRETISLQTRVEKEMQALNFKPEAREFHPHLTLARIKSPRGVEKLMGLVNPHKDLSAGSCLIDKIILFRSELKPAGAVYTKLKVIPLQP